MQVLVAALCVILVACEARPQSRISEEMLERIQDVFQCCMHIRDIAEGLVENNLGSVIGSTPEELFSMCRQSQAEDELELTSIFHKKEMLNLLRK